MSKPTEVAASAVFDWRPLRGLSTAVAVCWLAGCAVTPPSAPPSSPPVGKRHSPAEIAAYEPAQFSTPVASEQGTRKARDEAFAAVARAAAGGADDDTIAQALRAVAFYDTQIAVGQRLLQAVLTDTVRPLPQRTPEFQRAVLTAAFSLDATGTAPFITPLLDQFTTPRQFAIAAYTLRKADASAAQRARLRDALARRTDRDEPRLVALARALDADDAATPPIAARPPLADLLAAPLKPGLPVIYSLQRRDRRNIGLAVVRDVDGRFVRGADGKPFNIPHLALALSGLPGTITLGNTPQGLFTVVGAGTADNPWIGPTPFLESKIPKEATLTEFAHAPAEGEWTEARYEAWLPASWRSYAPMKEAWLAGLAGRDEMYSHGTAVDPEPYRGRSYYPGTPTDGCMMAQEFWSPDGRLLKSDQLALARAFTRSGVDQGYIVVVEIDDKAAAVTLDEVLAELQSAEARR